MTTITETWVSQQLAPTQPSLHLRLIRPEDLVLLCEMHHRLSSESIYLRYLQYKVPSLDELAAVCQLSPERGAAFVATVKSGKERLVGLAYYMIDSAGARPIAELGILVEDQFQGQGIGRALWQRLHQHARGEQIHGLRVLFDPINWRVLRLLRGSGYPYHASSEDDINNFMVLLDQQPQSSRIQQMLEKFGAPILNHTQAQIEPFLKGFKPQLDAVRRIQQLFRYQSTFRKEEL